MRQRVYRSVKALNGAAIALYWKSSERQNSTHLTVLKQQNIKISLYQLSKNLWVIAFFGVFGSVRKKIQSTVVNDRPVCQPLSNNCICQSRVSPARELSNVSWP